MTDMLDITRTSAILLLKLDLLSECLQIQNYVKKTVADPALPPPAGGLTIFSPVY